MRRQIESAGDVRRFAALICLGVLIVDTLLRDLALLPGALTAVMIAAPLAYAMGQRLRANQRHAQALEHALHHDSLTGVRSRASLRAGVPGDTARPCAVIVADIDHFKRFNDCHGHVAGDLALRHFAQLLRENCRAGDLVARLGGEEFVILMPMTNPANALRAANRMARRIRQGPVFLDTGPQTLTASFGVAALLPGDTLDAGLQRADRALYRAKGAGRDRACLHDPTLDAGPGQTKANQKTSQSVI
ncbi:GGDEF domain-containing protein [Roseovarius mucosus]|uniref:GGDEF domain-containing protein n=1 Tax=Roseovarius mucosus TaxID=215743 RepID=UPI003F6EA26E